VFVVGVLAIHIATPLNVAEATIGLGGAVINALFEGLLRMAATHLSGGVFPVGTFGLASDLAGLGVEVSSAVAVLLGTAGIIIQQKYRK